MVAELRIRGVEQPALAWDFSSHGSSRPALRPIDWWDFGRDALEVVQLAGADEVVGIGHSMGAAALVLAELMRPGTFTRLLLVEPIVFPAGSRDEKIASLVRLAHRRRRSFASLAEARENFSAKLFVGWDERAIDAYLAGALRREEGMVWLACRPVDEAAIYQACLFHGAYDRLGEVGVPATVVAGEHSDTHFPDFVDLLCSRFRAARPVIVPGVSHFLPMERPDLLAELVAAEVAAA